jgi:hypothetical protein
MGRAQNKGSTTMNETKTHITIKEGDWRASNKAGEANVQGRFLLQDELKAAQSIQAKKPVYEPIVVCQIKVLQPSNGDIICHQIIEGDAKSEELKQRFKTAYDAFSELLAPKNKKQKDSAEPKKV